MDYEPWAHVLQVQGRGEPCSLHPGPGATDDVLQPTVGSLQVLQVVVVAAQVRLRAGKGFAVRF